MTENCIHCGLCAKNCEFLKKYDLNLATFSQRPDLSYHCFLCGECSRVCPKGIDGRKIALDMRCAMPTSKGYGMLLWEKKNYKFRNYKGVKGKVALFPGCNFPSFFPTTTDKLVSLLSENSNIGVVYDCCGKPVSELGFDGGIKELESRLKANGIEELVILCPNCYYFLKGKIEIAITDIYAKLRELGLGDRITDIAGETVNVFIPCPDRQTGELEKSIASFFTCERRTIEGVQCCGMGGCASVKEPDLSAAFGSKVKAMNLPNVYTYCATCAGTLNRQGVKNVKHVLVEILNTGESPELTIRSLWNRVKKKF